MSHPKRRILGRDDRGNDVELVQLALNCQLPWEQVLPPPEWDWRVESKRLFPTLWGYAWAPGAYAKARRTDRRPFESRPTQDIKRIDPLVLDGSFGPKTEKAVEEFQRRCGLPDDGLVGPETWDHLFPYWRFIVWIPAEQPQEAGGGQQGQSGGEEPAKPKGPFVGSPLKPSDFDTVEFQVGRQTDGTNAFVLQGTLKVRREPNEVLPGQWNHTGGGQVNVPADGSPGKNIQFYYQLTRDEMLTVENFLGAGKLTLVAPFVQPYVQFPRDQGTAANPNTRKGGINFGNTISLEIKGGEGKPSVKLFVQGTIGPSVDGGGAHFEKQAFGGISFAFDEAALLGLIGKKKPEPSKPASKVGVRVQPPVLVVPRGGASLLDVTTDRNGYTSRMVLKVQNLPPGVSAERVLLGTDFMNRLEVGARIPVRAAPDAPPGEYTAGVEVTNELPPVRPLTQEPARFTLKVQ